MSVIKQERTGASFNQETMKREFMHQKEPQMGHQHEMQMGHQHEIYKM